MASTDSSENISRPTKSGDLTVIKSVVATGSTGSSFKVDRWPVTVTLVCSSSSGSVQYSTSLYSEIVAGTATWQTWARGTISATASDIPEGPITGIRGVSSSGAVTLEVVY